MATTVARLQAVLSADTRDFDRGMRKSETTMGKVGKAAKVGLAVGVGVAAVALKKSVGAALEAEKAEMRLDQAFDSAKVSAKARQKATEAVSRVSRKAALDDEDLSDVLARLTRSTGSVEKATEGMGLAAEVARGRNVSLEAASKAVEKAYLGQDMALRRLGVVVPKVNDAVDKLKMRQKLLTAEYKAADGPQKQIIRGQLEEIKNSMDAARELDKRKTAQNALAEAQKQFAGSSEKFGETAAGAHERFQVAVENLQEAIGKQLLPALTQLFQVLVRGVTYLEKNSGQAKLLAIAIGALTTALIAAKIAQIALNLAVLANPYVAAGVAVIAFTALIVILWRKFEGARDAIVLFVSKFSPLAAAILLVMNRSDELKDALGRLKTATLNVFDPLIKAATAVKKVLSAIVSAVKWLIDHIPDIPDLPSVPDPRDLFNGDSRGPSPAGPAGPRGPVGLDGALPVMQPFASSAASFGLSVTSGLRPGARTKHGTLSDHALGKAIDVSNGVNTPQMAGFFRSLIGNRSVKQAFYDPLGSIFNGALTSYREGGHSNHVHVATYDQGGFLRPGWNLAYNGLGRPEPVGAGVTFNFPNYVGSKAELMGWLQNAAQEFKRRNGRSAF